MVMRVPPVMGEMAGVMDRTVYGGPATSWMSHM